MRFHNNPFFLALLGLLALAVCWFSGVALWQYYRYATLSAKTPSQAISWSVKENASDNFVVGSKYTFTVEGKTYQGEYYFKDKHLNTWAAEQMIKRYSEKKWQVWYQPGNEQHSALQKKFPTKECLSALVLWALLLYFLWLGYYVNSFRK